MCYNLGSNRLGREAIMNKLLFFGILALSASASVESAMAQMQPRTTRSGQPVRVYSFWDCTRGNTPQASGSAAHGTVATREATQNRCGNPKQPVIELYYTPQAGFKGEDEVFVNRSGGHRGRRLSVKVNVL